MKATETYLILCQMDAGEITLKEAHELILRLFDVSGSIPSESELVSETADAYCPNCDTYIVNERVTFDECCDKCGEEIEWHE